MRRTSQTRSIARCPQTFHQAQCCDEGWPLSRAAQKVCIWECLIWFYMPVPIFCKVLPVTKQTGPTRPTWPARPTWLETVRLGKLQAAYEEEAALEHIQKWHICMSCQMWDVSPLNFFDEVKRLKEAGEAEISFEETEMWASNDSRVCGHYGRFHCHGRKRAVPPNDHLSQQRTSFAIPPCKEAKNRQEFCGNMHEIFQKEMTGKVVCLLNFQDFAKKAKEKEEELEKKQKAGRLIMLWNNAEQPFLGIVALISRINGTSLSDFL